MIWPGYPVEVRDAFGVWRPATADSCVEGTHEMRDGRLRKIHDFPVVWVIVRTGQRLPWPAEDVRPINSPEEAADDVS